MKAQVEGEAGIGVEQLEDFMSWLVRGSAEFVTRCSSGNDGKPANERSNGTPGNKPMAQFGASVLQLPLDAQNIDDHKIEPRMRPGVCLGFIDRTEEVIVGAENGVVRCRVVKRRPEGQQWSDEAIKNMKGSVWTTIAGSPG